VPDILIEVLRRLCEVPAELQRIQHQAHGLDPIAVPCREDRRQHANVGQLPDLGPRHRLLHTRAPVDGEPRVTLVRGLPQRGKCRGVLGDHDDG
jgi:hypothetical protein